MPCSGYCARIESGLQTGFPLWARAGRKWPGCGRRQHCFDRLTVRCLLLGGWLGSRLFSCRFGGGLGGWFFSCRLCSWLGCWLRRCLGYRLLGGDGLFRGCRFLCCWLRCCLGYRLLGGDGLFRGCRFLCCWLRCCFSCWFGCCLGYRLFGRRFLLRSGFLRCGFFCCCCHLFLLHVMENQATRLKPAQPIAMSKRIIHRHKHLLLALMNTAPAELLHPLADAALQP
jgi:hypothetical protein